MNDRIKLLAEQARQDYITNHWPTGVSADSVGMYPQLMEQFAESIVRECIQEVKDMAILMDAGHDQWNRAIGHTVLHLKEHFGVEE